MAHDVSYHRLGRVVEHDPRSRAFALPESDLSNLVSVDWTRHAPVFQQGDLGSCTGQSALGATCTGSLYDALHSVGKVPTMTQEYAVDIYSRATQLDAFPGEYPPVDTGSSGLAVAKVLKEREYIKSYLHAFSFNAAVTALQKSPVITGVNWYSSFYHPNLDGECVITSRAIVDGGHEIVVDAIDVENKRVRFTNSWGKTWGRDGRAWFSFDTWRRLLSEMGDVTSFTPLVEAEPAPKPESKGCLFGLIAPVRNGMTKRL